MEGFIEFQNLIRIYAQKGAGTHLKIIWYDFHVFPSFSWFVYRP